jgi:putative FmdB family regulatory protein
MPTYEYACTSCGEHLEVVQSFRDDSLTECPACGGPLRKVFGSIGIVFKGSGFYKTDSRPGDAKKPSADTAAAADSGSSSKETAAPAKEAAGGGGAASGSSSDSSSKPATPSAPSKAAKTAAAKTAAAS